MNFLQAMNKLEEKKLFFYIWIYLLSAWVLSMLIPTFFETGRYISDYVDINTYHYRANFVYTDGVPVSEYPQIPTYLFGLNELIVGFFNTRIRALMFYAFFTLEMIVVLFFVIKILYKLLPFEQQYKSLLMLLPPTFYFVINRFDILPAFLCTIALLFAKKQKWIFASIVLAAATFTKWYPVLIFPGFFVYASFQEKKIQWKMIAFFLLASVLIVVPTYIQGGVEALMFPYRIHTNRGMEYAALPVLINNFLINFENIALPQQSIFLFFFALQIIPSVSALFFKINTLERLVNYCIFVISMFILFSRINSPQWFLWLLPLLIISSESKTDIGIIVLYNIVTYLLFPVAFDLFGPSSFQMQMVAITCYLLLGIIVIRSFRDLKIGVKPFPFNGYWH